MYFAYVNDNNMLKKVMHIRIVHIRIIIIIIIIIITQSNHLSSGHCHLIGINTIADIIDCMRPGRLRHHNINESRLYIVCKTDD